MIRNMSVVENIKKELRKVASPKKAKASAWFFFFFLGEYGYGDKFIGVTVPDQRKIAKQFSNIEYSDIKTLLDSEIHEERLTAIFILVTRFEKADTLERERIFNFYMLNIKRVNNWDLVDSSAHKIIGEFIKDKKITLLLDLAKSENLWKRRIAIISTFAFLSMGDSKPTYLVADLLLSDREDLIQKAVGWVLREAGKKVSEQELKNYLKANYKKMGRTALRYSIEKFSPQARLEYLAATI